MEEQARLTLVVPLSGGSARARDSAQRLLAPTSPVVFPLARLADGDRRVLRERDYEHLALVGAPPLDEIGYGLTPLIALAARPRHVALIDLERERLIVEPLRKHLVRAAPFAAVQVLVSAAAVAAQRAAVPFARGTRHRRAPARELSKIVYIRPAAGSSSGIGGSVTHSHEVIRALLAQGIEVQAFTSDANIASIVNADASAGYRWSLIKTPRPSKAFPASAAAGGDLKLLKAALSAARAADAIYQRHGRFSLVGALLARLAQRPLLLEYNGSEVFSGRYWNPTPLQKQLAACEDAALAAATRIFVVSEANRRSLLKRGIAPGRIIVNPNGVDVDRFAVGGGSEIRRRHGIDRSSFVIGFVGTFGPWHGAPVLGRAFIEIARRHSQCHLLLVGEGRERDETYQIIRDAGFEDSLTSVGLIGRSDVPRYLDACDVLVSPHVPLPNGVEFFGSPTKLFEYMAAGKAIVASGLGQIADVLENRVTACLVPPGNVQKLVEALLDLAESPQLRRELGARARCQAIHHHTWHGNARRVIRAYGNIALE